MKKLNLFIGLAWVLAMMTSCDIQDRNLDHSDLFHYLEQERENGSNNPGDPGSVSKNPDYDANCKLSVKNEVTLTDCYAASLSLQGTATGYRYKSSNRDLSTQEVLDLMKRETLHEMTSLNLVEQGLWNVEANLYIMPFNGDKFGDITVIKLPAKSTEGFTEKVGVAETSYVDQYSQVLFAATEYSFKAHIFKASDVDRYDYRNDAVYALLLDNDGKLYPANVDATEIQTYNPSRERTIVVARAINKSGEYSKTITKKIVY